MSDRTYGQFTLSKVEDGKSVTVLSTEYEYKLSTSGTTPPSGTWEKNPVAPTASQYAWTKTTVTFSDGNKSITYTVGGKTGTNGTSVTILEPEENWYQKSTSGTDIPTGAWSSTPIEPTETEYVWTKTIIHFSNGSDVTTYTVGGKTGQTGPKGKGISKIETQYYLSTSNTKQEGGSWNATPAAYVSGRYYWRRDHIIWTEGAPTDTTAVLDNALTTANKNAYDAQYAVDNMEIGGRNYIRNTRDYSGWGCNNGTTFVEATPTYIINFPTATSSTWREAWQGVNLPYSAIRNRTVTFSAKVKAAQGDACTIFFCIGLVASETSTSRLKWFNLNTPFTGTDSWQVVTNTFYVTDASFTNGTGSPDYDTCFFNIRLGSVNKSLPGFQAKEVKCDLGNVATDWSPAPEDVEDGIDNALSRGVEYIVGTQTAQTNVWRGVTTDSTLETGKTIAYYLPYAGTSTPATLNLTLSTGIATGAKPVKINDTAVTTHYPAGAIIKLTFDGTSWKSDNYSVEDRLQLNNIVSSSSAIGAGRIVCSDSDGYKQIAAGVTFDISYPLLYSPDAIAANTETRNLFLTYPNVNATTNGSIEGGASGKTLFLKGTLNEGMFTISSSPFLTTVAPTSVGYHYIPIGTMTSPQYLNFESQNKLYTFVIPEGSSTGSFQAVDAIGNLLAFDTIARLKTLEPIVNEHSTTLSTLEDKIVSKVEESFVAQDDFNSYFNTASSQITQDAKKLRLDFDAVEKLINGDGTDEGKGLRKEFDDFTKKVNKFFLFGNDGLTIGTDKSSLKLVLDNDLVGFYNGNTQIAYWDGATLHTGNVEVQTFKLGKTSDDSIGNYVATPRDDGSVVWNWQVKVSNGGD